MDGGGRILISVFLETSVDSSGARQGCLACFGCTGSFQRASILSCVFPSFLIERVFSRGRLLGCTGRFSGASRSSDVRLARRAGRLCWMNCVGLWACIFSCLSASWFLSERVSPLAGLLES